MRRRLLLSPKLSLTCLPCTSASFNASSQVVRTPSSGSILQRSGLSSTEVSEPLEARGMGRLCLFEDIASLPDQALPLGHKCLSSWSTFPKWGCPCLFCVSRPTHRCVSDTTKIALGFSKDESYSNIGRFPEGWLDPFNVCLVTFRCCFPRLVDTKNGNFFQYGKFDALQK